MFVKKMDILSFSKKDIKKWVGQNKIAIYNHLILFPNYSFLKHKPIDLIENIVTSWLINIKDFKKRYKLYNFTLIKDLEKLKI